MMVGRIPIALAGTQVLIMAVFAGLYRLTEFGANEQMLIITDSGTLDDLTIIEKNKIDVAFTSLTNGPLVYTVTSNRFGQELQLSQSSRFVTPEGDLWQSTFQEMQTVSKTKVQIRIDTQSWAASIKSVATVKESRKISLSLDLDQDSSEVDRDLLSKWENGNVWFDLFWYGACRDLKTEDLVGSSFDPNILNPTPPVVFGQCDYSYSV